jgi:hypothetical protein
MKRQAGSNPLLQQIKGIFIFREDMAESDQAFQLLKTLDCEVVNNHDSRVMIRTHRGNLQAIKKCWQSNDETNLLSKELNKCISQIIIGS